MENFAQSAPPAPGLSEADELKIHAAVEQLAAGPEFARSARMIRFLEYVAEQSLRERPEVTERQIGIAVFDRDSDWDPKIDPIVRIEARRLREKLTKHYSAMADPPNIVLTMPKGSYRLQYEIHLPSALTTVPEVAPSASRSRRRLRWASLVGILVLALFVSIATLLSRRGYPQIREDRSIQVSAFKVSREAEKLGSGPALAGMLADQVRTLQAKTRISWPATPVEDIWTDETPAPVFTRLRRKLASIALADDTFRKLPASISGFVTQTGPERIELYIRSNAFAPRTFQGQPSEWPEMLVRVAEYVYAECQPAAFSVYLDEHARFAEAITFSQQHYARATQVADKLQLLFSWSIALENQGELAAAAEGFRSALELFPQSWGAYTSLINTYVELGQASQALEAGELLEQKAHRGSWLYAHLPPSLFRPVRPDTFLPVDLLKRDALSLKRSLEAEIAATAGAGIHQEGILPAYADALVQLHEFRQARLELQVAKSVPSSRPADLLQVSADLALASGDIPSLKSVLKPYREILIDPEQRRRLDLVEEDLCSLAVAYNQVGDREAADVLLKDRRPSMACLQSKAEVLTARGEDSLAQSLFLQAIQRGDRLPVPHYRYGLLLAKQGKDKQASTELALARKYGPHWAEPAKALAELDLKSGNAQQAFEEFAAASKNAPRWAELFSKWGEALIQCGHIQEGEEKLRLAKSFQ